MREREVSYSKLARSADIGMATAKELYENPYYQMNIATLYKCCRFFGVQPGDLLEMELQTA